MQGRGKNAVLAVSATVLDAVVLQHCGLVVWQVLGGIVWIRMSLLLLASVWAYSLIDIWAHVLARNPERQIEESRLPDSIPALQRELPEGADV